MSENPKVLLITGPSGSGKSTLAQSVAEKLDWAYVCEDDFWVKTGWGVDIRTAEQERVIQTQVNSKVTDELNKDKGVVLEFILYKKAPNTLTAYQESLTNSGIEFDTIALKPPVGEILNRIANRGRAADLDNPKRRLQEVESQLQVIEPELIHPGLMIDPTGMSIDLLRDMCIERIFHSPHI
ncbi:MAG TPA: AAA family ATPase [Candidatus Saccharibacteria bacterium]|nr:AAA family ATPase [Candidatus Saccharibacteria bacterium]